MFGRALFLICLTSASVAIADEATDTSPVRCAWSHLASGQQERLRKSFSVDNTGPNVGLQFPVLSPEETAVAAAPCNLAFDGGQLAHLARALGARAAEEVGRMGVANRGAVKPAVIDRAIQRMHEGKRRIIGDALSCGGKAINGEWDQSLIGAMRRANIRTVDGRTVSLIAIVMYATFMQEGYMRRIAGTAASCAEFD